VAWHRQTPDFRQGWLRDGLQKCGNQPANKNIINRRLQACPVSSLPIDTNQILRKAAGKRALDLSY
jgi:hypothetical protein